MAGQLKKKIFLLLILVLFLPARTEAYKSRIKDIRFSTHNTIFRVVIELDKKTPFSSNTLKNPYRLYFDIRAATISSDTKRILTINRGPVRSIRAGRYKRDTIRVVFDLTNKAPYRVFTLENPFRIVVEIGDDPNPYYRERKIIVIDPGHGGHDPGAIGPGGTKEKDIALDIAKRLKRILEERYNLVVYLTRYTDKYLQLKERTEIANRKKADLFISIHANASRSRKARGIETYLLNWTNDEEALRVAARENAISVERMKKSQTELGMILTSLQREQKRDESLKLAHYIQRSLVGTLSHRYRSIYNLGVKQALFYVLVDAEMPSVLVEVGFISNPREEGLLRSKGFRQKTAEALAKGIFRYLLTLPDAPKLAMNTANLP